MIDHRPIPWPASWPPFWRTVVHVLIATAATNLLVAVYAVLGVLCRDVAFFLAVLIAMPLFPVVIMCWLTRAPRPVRRALYRAFFLGTLCLVVVCNAASVPFVWFLDWREPEMLLFEDGGVWIVSGIVVLSACAGFGVTGWSFSRTMGGATSHGVYRACRLGVLLLILGAAWGGWRCGIGPVHRSAWGGGPGGLPCRYFVRQPVCVGLCGCRDASDPRCRSGAIAKWLRAPGAERGGGEPAKDVDLLRGGMYNSDMVAGVVEMADTHV